MPAYQNTQNSQATATAPGPHTQALLDHFGITDSFLMPPSFSQEDVDSLDAQQMHALLSGMVAPGSQHASQLGSPQRSSEDNFLAMQPFEFFLCLMLSLLIMANDDSRRW